jgi:predicted TIM-barrel fold metal-dependent hydrolase
MPKDSTATGWDCHVHIFDGQASVAPGHYPSAHHPLEAIEAVAHSHGFGHLVLVQPSVYGTNNALLLSALAATPGRHRGVVVVDAAISDAALYTMHELGVRGVRFNLVSPAGNRSDIATHFSALAPRLHALGWHVQWYAHPEDLPTIASLHQGTPVPAVLDHLAGLHTALPLDHAAFNALNTLAGLGAWVKLSGWYRLQATAPYTQLDGLIQRVAAAFTGRMVWGSDWPHTFFDPQAMPTYSSTLAPVARVLSGAQKNQLWTSAPSQLYA